MHYCGVVALLCLLIETLREWEIQACSKYIIMIQGVNVDGAKQNTSGEIRKKHKDELRKTKRGS